MTVKDFSPEVEAKLAKCKTAEELYALAKENNVDLTEEQVSGILKASKKGELSEEDLAAVTGGKSTESSCGKGPHGIHAVQ
jgi:hypothetical protein